MNSPSFTPEFTPERSRIFVISHTHWDREWYLSRRQFQFLLGDILSSLIKIFESDPDFRCFMADGQTSIIEDFLEIRPEAREDLLALIKAGRIQIGPWYTMPDLWLSDGEALIRNLLTGRRDCQKYGAEFPHLGYVPDSFGHIEQMPQILNGFGIENYVFGRGEPLESLEGALEFYWIAPDGKSRVLAHRLPHGYQNGAMLPAAEKTDEIMGVFNSNIKAHQNRSARPDLTLMMNGVDHIWVQSDLSAILKEAGRLFPQQELIHGTLLDYVRKFSEFPLNLKERSGVLRNPHLYSELLEGTWSSRIDNKIENYRATMVLKNWAEPLSALAQWHLGSTEDVNALELAWRLVLQNHAHDSICGCSVDRVHTEVSQRFIQAQEIGEMIADKSLQALGKNICRDKGPSLIRFTGLGGADGCEEFIIDTDTDAAISLHDILGQSIPTQRLSCRKLRRSDAVVVRGNDTDGGYQRTELRQHEFWEHRVLARLPKAAPCNLQSYKITSIESSYSLNEPVKVEGHTLENHFIRAEVSANGSLTVTHKKNHQVYTGLLTLVDQADLGGGYSFIPLDGDVPWSSHACCAQVSIIEQGPLRAGLLVTFTHDLPSGLNEAKDARDPLKVKCDWRMEVRLEAGSETLSIRASFTNRARQHRLRLAMPLPFERPSTNVERAFIVSNETLENYTHDAGQNSHPMQNWISAHNASGGIAFIGMGLHEWALEENLLSVTLLRSVPFVGMCGSWETPDALLLKEISYEFALTFFSGDWHQGAVHQRAAQFLNPSAITLINGKSPEWSEMPHASVKLEEIGAEGTHEVSSWRNCWLKHFNQRDGWRREEASRPATRIASVTESLAKWDDPDITLSALKLSEDRRTGDTVIRLCNVADVAKRTAIRLEGSVFAVKLVNLAEDELRNLEIKDQQVVVELLPHGIVTLRCQYGNRTVN